MRDEARRGAATVLFVDPVGEIGGAEVVLLDIMSGLDRRRFCPRLVCLRPGPFAAEARRRGIPAHELRPHRTRQLHRMAVSLLRLAALARRHRPRIVHANLGNGLLYGWVAARACGARLVWHVHDPHRTDDAFGTFFAVVQRRMRPDWTIFATTTVGESYERQYPRLGRRSTIFGGVARASRGDGSRARRRLGIPADAPVVLSLGRLQRFKGQHLLIAVLPEVLAVVPDTHLVIAGGTLFGREPEYRQALAHQASRPDVAGRVHLTGFVDDDVKHDLLEACTVLAHPAESEPLGIALLEAMSHHRPVVAFDASGPSAIVVDGVTGLLVANGDRRRLAAAITEVLSDRERAAAMGSAGGRRAAEHFSVDASVQRFQAVYDAISDRT